MTVIIDYRTGGKEENKNVECYWEDSHYLYLKFKESCKVKQRKYIRRNVKLNCIMASEVGGNEQKEKIRNWRERK